MNGNATALPVVESIILKDFTIEEETHTVAEVVEFINKPVTTYLINGHGLEYPLYNNSQTIVLPPNCTVVVAMHPGKQAYIGAKDYFQRMDNLCTMPIEIIENGLRYKRSFAKKDRIIDLILNRDADILHNLGPVSIYRGGEECPNFQYELISYINTSRIINGNTNTKRKKPNTSLEGFTNYGSGIISVEDYRETEYCKHSRVSVRDILVNPKYHRKDTDPEIIDKTRECLLEQFKNSVNPTVDQINQSIDDFNHIFFNTTVPMIKLTNPTFKLTGSIYLLSLLKKFKNDERYRHIFIKTQDQLCRELMHEGREYVFLHFLCRKVDSVSEYFEKNKKAPRNNIIGIPNWTKNTELERLLLRSIKNTMKNRRHQVRASLNVPFYSLGRILMDPRIDEFHELKELVEQLYTGQNNSGNNGNNNGNNNNGNNNNGNNKNNNNNGNNNSTRKKQKR